MDDELFGTPSAAAEHIMAGKRDGWREWSVLDGSGLTDIRWRYRVGTFPENSDMLSEKTVRQKRNRAERWLEFALKQNLDPGQRNESAIEAFLGERVGLSEKTLGNYRAHLDQWFQQCDRHNW